MCPTYGPPRVTESYLEIRSCSLLWLPAKSFQPLNKPKALVLEDLNDFFLHFSKNTPDTDA
jgi:hypothetical protein